MERHNFINSFVLLFVVLMGFYISQNWEKAELSLKKISAIIDNTPAQKLVLNTGTEIIGKYDLPSSDIFDRSGKRQINFKYLSQNEFLKLTESVSKIKVSLNNLVIKQPLFVKHDNALSLILPNKHIFFIEPPHMETAVSLLKVERENKYDVFLCDGPNDFCSNVSISNFGGLTERKDPHLKKDGFFNTLTAPAGRYMGWRTQYEISSDRKQTIFLRLKLFLPLQNKTDKKKKRAVKVLLQVNGQPVKYRLEKKEGPYLFKPAVLYIMLPLHKGKNTLKMAFSKVIKASNEIPFDTTGILTEMLYSKQPRFN